MKIDRVISYKNKETKAVLNFVWIRTTHIGDPPVESCLEVEEVPEQKTTINGKEVELDAKMRFGIASGKSTDKDLHDLFVEGEFRTGRWELLEKPRPIVPDIPLPDPSEFRAPRANRGLLDSASSRFRKPPS